MLVCQYMSLSATLKMWFYKQIHWYPKNDEIGLYGYQTISFSISFISFKTPDQNSYMMFFQSE